jgi:hypothetical protein
MFFLRYKGVDRLSSFDDIKYFAEELLQGKGKARAA